MQIFVLLYKRSLAGGCMNFEWTQIVCIIRWTQIVCIIIGSCILGLRFGIDIGFAIAFIAYALMPIFH